MMKVYFTIRLILGSIRCIPHLVLFYFHRNRSLIEADLKRWIEIKEVDYSTLIGFLYLLNFSKEYRNVFYYRIGDIRFFINFICPAKSSLIINSKSIGEGFYIQHGDNTLISAKSIGKNCWINQQVTIGYLNDTDCPTILDNVSIRAAAVVLGNITIGNNSVIGANSTVFTNVPDNSTVVPPLPNIIQWKK